MTPQHHLPADIERTSMRIITEELARRGQTIQPQNAAVDQRVIQTPAAIDYAHNQHPAIVAMGRKGGSNVAAAICNALVYSAAEMLDPKARGWQ